MVRRVCSAAGSVQHTHNTQLPRRLRLGQHLAKPQKEQANALRLRDIARHLQHAASDKAGSKRLHLGHGPSGQAHHHSAAGAQGRPHNACQRARSARHKHNLNDIATTTTINTTAAAAATAAIRSTARGSSTGPGPRGWNEPVLCQRAALVQWHGAWLHVHKYKLARPRLRHTNHARQLLVQQRRLKEPVNQRRRNKHRCVVVRLLLQANGANCSDKRLPLTHSPPCTCGAFHKLGNHQTHAHALLNQHQLPAVKPRHDRLQGNLGTGQRHRNHSNKPARSRPKPLQQPRDNRLCFFTISRARAHSHAPVRVHVVHNLCRSALVPKHGNVVSVGCQWPRQTVKHVHKQEPVLGAGLGRKRLKALAKWAGHSRPLQ